jgi:hypothetical protein
MKRGAADGCEGEASASGEGEAEEARALMGLYSGLLEFPERFRAVEGSPRRLRTRFLVCSEPLCGAELDITDNGERPLPDDVARRKFSQKGWRIGRDREHDLCPTCVANERQSRRKPREEVVKIDPDKNIPLTERAVRIAGGSLPENPPPRQMDTDERRIIFGKIDENWAGKEEGYRTPWTDQAIARELGIPLAWVVEVRSQFFGEVRDNQEVREILARIESASFDARKLIEDAKDHVKTAQELNKRTNALHAAISDLSKSLEGAAAIASRIERALK